MQVVANRFVLSYGGDWEARYLSDDVYHFRHKNWIGYYWKVDKRLKKVYKVTGHEFGSALTDGEAINGIDVETNDYGNTMLKFSSAYLEYFPAKDILRFIAEGSVILDADSLEVRRIGSKYHFRHVMWEKFKLFWECDVAEGSVYGVEEGQFGEVFGGRRESTSIKIAGKQLYCAPLPQ